MAVQKIRNIAEFAQLSGISRPTVSKLFSAIPRAMRKSIRSKIERALARYDYRPNLFAVNLGKRPKIIGVIVPDTSDMFFSEMVRHIEMRCALDGCFVLVLSSRGDPVLEARSSRNAAVAEVIARRDRCSARHVHRCLAHGKSAGAYPR